MPTSDSSPALLAIVPALNDEQISLHGKLWTIKVVSVWPSGPGLYPDFDILCHLQPADGNPAHCILLEVDRLFIHQKNAKGATLCAIERTLLDGLRMFARISCSGEASQPLPLSSAAR